MKRLAAAAVLGTAIGLCGVAPAAATAPAAGLSETSQLGNRRFVVTGDRAYEVGAEDATYPGTGWHIRGEMGGFWSQPIKLLDGVWFAADGTWLTAKVNGTSVGILQLVAGAGKLQLESERGLAVPAIRAGDMVTVTTASGVTILSGKF